MEIERLYCTFARNEDACTASMFRPVHYLLAFPSAGAAWISIHGGSMDLKFGPLRTLAAALALTLVGCDNGSNPTNEVSPPQPPEAPTDLAVVFNRPDMRNELSWTVNSTDEDGFRILSNVDDAGWTEIGDVDHGTSTYIDHGVSELTVYEYRVYAYRDTLNSDTTDAARIEIDFFGPNELSASADINGIHLFWNDYSSIEDGFGLIRKDGVGGDWAPLAETGTNDIGYTDLVNLVPDTVYYYRVYAHVFKGGVIVHSDTSNTVSVLWQNF